jgi:hypothetical protein
MDYFDSACPAKKEPFLSAKHAKCKTRGDPNAHKYGNAV